MKYMKKNCLHSSLQPDQALALLLTAFLSLSACSSSALVSNSVTMQDSQKPAASNSAQTQTQTQTQTLRVIVKFKYAVPYRDGVFLRALGQKINARITYITSVFPDIHVYQIEPQRSQSRADVFQSLSSNPAILYVEADAVVKPF